MKKKTKKVFFILLGIVVLAGILFGVIFICSRNKTDSPKEEYPSFDVEIPEIDFTGDISGEGSIETSENEEDSSAPDDSEEISTEEESTGVTLSTEVRGIYVTGPMAGSEGFEDLITLVDETELNTMVIDIKDDNGNITYKSDAPCVSAEGTCIGYIRDIDGMMSRLKEKNIYTIARIACFKDNNLAENRPDLAIKAPDGAFVTDGNGLKWVNPYSEEVWDYLCSIAEEAYSKGFDEVQFDYVRFPVGNTASKADYGVEPGTLHEDGINGFLSYATERLNAQGIPVGADLFGTVMGSETDRDTTGQDYVAISEIVDVVCPMVYPSHYANGSFGQPVPDAAPYETIKGAMDLSVKEQSKVTGDRLSAVRPWLQCFTAKWVNGYISYDVAAVEKEIDAVYDAGYTQWILWNASNRYDVREVNMLPKNTESVEKAENTETSESAE